MVGLISQKSTYYKMPSTVKIADSTYNGILSLDSRELIDNDGRRKTVHYMDGEKSSFVSYVEQNKVTRSNEYFYRPQTMKLGDKVYSGVVSKTTLPGKFDVFVVNNSAGSYNELRVRNNGAVLDITKFRNQVALRKIKQSFLKLGKLFIK